MTDTTVATMPEAVSVDTWTQLVSLVDECEGVATVTMQTLREVAGAGRLGSTVRAQIKEKINSLGLATIRDELPNTQDATVILYKADSHVGRVVQAVVNARGSTDLEDAAQTLRSLNDETDPSNIRVEVLDALSHLDKVAVKARKTLA